MAHSRKNPEAIKRYPDGRIRCRTKTAWEKIRKIVFDREEGLCEGCMTWAPLHNTEDAFAGHAHHINGRKEGNDHPDVLKWLCGRCHSKAHIPDKVVPAKPKYSLPSSEVA
jgi:5-methylcytosine-specific restriction endonuclease McrA